MMKLIPMRPLSEVLGQDHLPTNHMNVAHKLVFNFHSDASHGWLAVKKTLVRELGIIKDITLCSYMQGKTVYLEEDCDMRTFMIAFKERFGIDPQIKYLESKDRSPIRSMKRFEMEA